MNAYEDRTIASPIERRVKLVADGIRVGDEVVPLRSGSVHYWRLDPNDWRPCLEAVKRLGLRLVDTYIPWGVHEVSPGKLELGQADPQRDIAAFCRIAESLGLYVIARPGPHINAELTYFGLPKRIVWDAACQARSPEQNPVMLPMLPIAFPVPSYASDAFHDEVARWFQLLGPVLEPLLFPNGPVVLLQIDNEGAFYFRDGAYDQDYHPDAVRAYRDFLRAKYGTIDALALAYGTLATDGDEPSSDITRFTSIDPPTKFDALATGDLARHLDWCEFHEHLLATAFERFVRSLATAGLSGLPTVHNLPPGQDATPLDHVRIGKVVDLVGQDYYHSSGQTSRTVIARATTELALHAEARAVPAFASEMGAGFPPFFPPLADRDGAFTVLSALAYGLRGFNVYMAVERDRWIGAPIDRRGRERPYAVFWRRLAAAMDATAFHTLRRVVPVRIVIPRLERRLVRAMHAFGPLSAPILSTFGAGPRERAVEDDLGLGYPVAIQADEFVRAFERALDRRGVPYCIAGADGPAFGDADGLLAPPRWLVCPTSGALDPAVFERLAEAHDRGVAVTLGPQPPRYGDAFRPLAASYDLTRLGEGALIDGVSAIPEAAVRAVQTLGLPAFTTDPDTCFVTVHEDRAGVARVVFVINPAEQPTTVRMTLGFACNRAVDPIDEAEFVVAAGALEVRMRPGSVRMLAIVQ